MTMAERFERVSKYLVGLWRFRERREQSKWAATYFVNGKYYDIYPAKTVEKALDLVYSNIKRMRKLKNVKTYQR